MTAIADDLENRIHQARILSDGPVKIAMLEEAVRLADCGGDMDWRFYARYEFIHACFQGGDPEKIYPAVNWCLAKCDELGTCFDPDRLLWGCKYALSYSTFFPQLTRPQIEALQQEVMNRFRKFGHTLSGPYCNGMLNQLAMGWPEPAKEHQRLWLREPRDRFSASENWNRYFQAYFLLETGQADQALEHAMPVLTDEKREPDAFQAIVRNFLLELLRHGQRDLALAIHRKDYPLGSRNPKYLAHCGKHLLFLALTGNVVRSTLLLERHLAWIFDVRVPDIRFEFCLDVWVALRQFRARGHDTVHLRLPRTFPFWREEGVYTCAVVAEWCEKEVHDLELRFNQRNGNDYFTQYIARIFALEPFAVDWPIG